MHQNHEYVLTAWFQSDSLEPSFSQYRQMNDGNFLVSLKEVSMLRKDSAVNNFDQTTC